MVTRITRVKEWIKLHSNRFPLFVVGSCLGYLAFEGTQVLRAGGRIQWELILVMFGMFLILEHTDTKEKETEDDEDDEPVY